MVKKQLDPAVLSTYEEYRHPLTQALVALATDLAEVYAGSIAPKEEVRGIYERLNRDGSGITIIYSPSRVITDSKLRN